MSDDLDLLQRFRSGIGQPAGARQDAQARLDDLIIGGTEGLELPARGPRKRRALAGLAAAACLAVALVVIQAVLPLGTHSSIDPAAASLLHRFSSLASRMPPEPAPQPGQYVYELTRSTSLYALVSSGTGASFRFFLPETTEQWLGTDGSGQSSTSAGQPTFLTAADRQVYEGYLASGYMAQEWGGFDWGKTSTERYRPGELTFFDFSGLPTNVAELQGMIERREIIGGPKGDWETFNLSADILTWSYAPPELRAALFEVMANLPGVEMIGPTKDAFGRDGIAVGYTHNGQRQEVVFERSTGKVLERRWVSVSGDMNAPDPGDVCSGPPGGCGATELANSGPPGTLSSVTTYKVYGGVVDKIGDVSESPR